MTDEDAEALGAAAKIVALIERSKISARTFLAALNSEQRAFEAADPTADGLPFITRCSDAPLQVIGTLGQDGVWRTSTYVISFAVEHEADVEVDAAEAADENLFVLCDGPVTERMIAAAIPKILANVTHPEVREAFERRLAASRFAMHTLH